MDDYNLLVEFKDLHTYFHLAEGVVRAVDGVDMKLHRGETLGVVGESGCGKSVTSLSLMSLLPPSAKIEIDPYNYDAGLMVEGGELLADLKIMNRGELELRVEFNHRSAAYEIAGKPAPVPLKIAAGKDAGVLIRIPTQNRTGAVREYVLIKSNDPMRSTLSLYISGYIITKEQLRELFGKYKDILR